MRRKTDNPSVLTVAAGGKDHIESCEGRKDKQLPAKRRTAECGTDQAVTISKGNLTQAAALLGISRPTLYKKMGMYGITKEQV